MSQDLNEILRDWPHKPGELQVRKITGSDGEVKIQLRMDMGLLQMEMNGRPDGQRPNEFESVLHYQQHLAEMKGEDFALTSDEIGELQSEGIQYYHRYIALFQLEDWKGVVRDTQRNLEMFDFVSDYANEEEVAWSVEQFRPYVLMMNTRAKAHIALAAGDRENAFKLIEKGIAKIERFLEENAHPELAGENAEVVMLREWLEELQNEKAGAESEKKKTPKLPNKLDRLEAEMEKAVKAELYEKAAELRDAIKALQKKS